MEESSITITLTQFVEGLLGKKVEEPKKPEPLDLINTNEEEGLPLGLTLSISFCGRKLGGGQGESQPC